MAQKIKKSKKKVVNTLNFLVNLKFNKFSKSLQRIRGTSSAYNFPRFSFSGINSASGLRILPQQLEAVRRVLKRTLRKRGNIYLFVFPNFAPTRKPNETRMGKGKGIPKFSVCCVKKNTRLFEILTFKVFALNALYKRAFKKVGLRFFSTFRYW
jgi:large subunit ribosomal protein L16